VYCRTTRYGSGCRYEPRDGGTSRGTGIAPSAEISGMRERESADIGYAAGRNSKKKNPEQKWRRSLLRIKCSRGRGVDRPGSPERESSLGGSGRTIFRCPWDIGTVSEVLCVDVFIDDCSSSSSFLRVHHHESIRDSVPTDAQLGQSGPPDPPGHLPNGGADRLPSNSNPIVARSLPIFNSLFFFLF
jgi:hypothetical protein